MQFLSGGISEENASVYLSAINSVPGPKPWNVSFSFGRALQASCIKAWAGKKENIGVAQKVLLQRCKANGLAATGNYAGLAASGASEAEIAASKESLFVSNYVY